MAQCGPGLGLTLAVLQGAHWAGGDLQRRTPCLCRCDRFIGQPCQATVPRYIIGPSWSCHRDGLLRRRLTSDRVEKSVPSRTRPGLTRAVERLWGENWGVTHFASSPSAPAGKRPSCSVPRGSQGRQSLQCASRFREANLRTHACACTHTHAHSLTLTHSPGLSLWRPPPDTL